MINEIKLEDKTEKKSKNTDEEKINVSKENEGVKVEDHDKKNN